MEAVEPILSLAASIYERVEEVKANKRQCERVAERVRALEGLVSAMGGGASTADPARVEAGLEKLRRTLVLAEKLIKKFCDTKLLLRFVRAYHLREDFADINDCLNDAFQELSLAFQVKQSHASRSAFELARRRAEDHKDQREDDRHFLQILQDIQETTNDTQGDVQQLNSKVETLIQTIGKPRMVNQDIRMIAAHELTYDPAPFMTSSTSQVYRGEYNKCTVAIKRFTSTPSTSPQDIRRVFDKEVKTMQRFESPNILRMFGICVENENGPAPDYLIVMEYCEKGSLRQVLDSPRVLTWSRRASMSLDAARGLYRLHQTEDKSKVHGCINSCKFLVAGGYRVKLGGLELAKTESSLRKSGEGQTTSLRYCSPQQLLSLHHVYDKRCEIYSFGIVLWEIATRKKPFEDCSSRLDVFNKVTKEKVREGLPDDCPPALRTVIDACRSYDPFHRPSAGVLVDKLRKVVDELEEE